MREEGKEKQDVQHETKRKFHTHKQHTKEITPIPIGCIPRKGGRVKAVLVIIIIQQILLNTFKADNERVDNNAYQNQLDRQ